MERTFSKLQKLRDQIQDASINDIRTLNDVVENLISVCGSLATEHERQREWMESEINRLEARLERYER